MKKFSIVYSQYISVDVNPIEETPKYVKACLIEDFNKWVLENKNIKLCFKDYWLVHPQIMEFLSEYLNMNISGWEIEDYSIKEGCYLVETSEGVKYFNEQGTEVKKEEVSFC